MVLIREEHGWLALFCTDAAASVQEIIEAFADRATIEQDFHDVKEVWGAGQQQVQHMDERGRVSNELVEAYAGGTLGLEPSA